MVNQRSLETMSKENITGVGANTLSDILTVTIVGETPAQRLESYLEQVNNPYFIRVGQTPVKLLFHNEGRPLSERLKSYFLTLKNSDF